MRWALALQEFDVSFKYKEGKRNTAADCLSRVGLHLPQPINRVGYTRVCAVLPLYITDLLLHCFALCCLLCFWELALTSCMRCV